MLGGTKVGEGSGDRLRSPAGPGQIPGRRPRGAKLLGFEYLGSFSSTFLKHFVIVMKCIKTHESSPKKFQIVSKQ